MDQARPALTAGAHVTDLLLDCAVECLLLPDGTAAASARRPVPSAA